MSVSEVSNESSSFEVNQNYPNPMVDRSEISMYIPHTGKVHVMITDLQGKIVLRTDRQLDGGHHSFRFHPGGGNLYFLTAYWNGVSDPEWDIEHYRGFDAGTNLKTTSGWYENGNGADLFGFSGLPGGNSNNNASVFRHNNYKTFGFSGRCLQD